MMDELTTQKASAYCAVNFKNIQKVTNARLIPCTVQEFSQITWPSTDVEIEQLPTQLETLLAGVAWFEEPKHDFENKQQIIDFIVKISILCKNIKETGQIHPISVDRIVDSRDFRLIAGERRVLAHVYSNGLIKNVKAVLYNQALSAWAFERLQYSENQSESPTAIEQLVGMFKIWNEASDEQKKKSNAFWASVWMHKSEGHTSRFRSIFRRNDAADVIRHLLTLSDSITVREIYAIAKENIEPTFIVDFIAELRETKKIASAVLKVAPTITQQSSKKSSTKVKTANKANLQRNIFEQATVISNAELSTLQFLVKSGLKALPDNVAKDEFSFNSLEELQSVWVKLCVLLGDK
ncbi:MAG: ParB N-terminal domain-containing protein, partial [Saccharospirillaceae bacterium]|nr:ParB/Srx family N-terminal domain-containing protein [Pseudomonadales bacterium]NRB81735.1 ParB N-terminal domain-containing protein [Saccharospirillaceae bacterium]